MRRMGVVGAWWRISGIHCGSRGERQPWVVPGRGGERGGKTYFLFCEKVFDRRTNRKYDKVDKAGKWSALIGIKTFHTTTTLQSGALVWLYMISWVTVTYHVPFLQDPRKEQISNDLQF